MSQGRGNQAKRTACTGPDGVKGPGWGGMLCSDGAQEEGWRVGAGRYRGGWGWGVVNAPAGTVKGL